MAEADFVIRFLLASVFLAGAIGKLRSPRTFAATNREVLALIRRRQNRKLAAASAAVVISYELLISLVLLTGRAPLAAATATIMLLIVFAGVGVVADRREAAIDCHCFGPSMTKLGVRTLGRSLSLIALAASFAVGSRFGDSAWFPSSASAWLSALAAVAGSAIVLAWLWNIDIPIRLIVERRRDATAARDGTTEPRATVEPTTAEMEG